MRCARAFWLQPWLLLQTPRILTLLSQAQTLLELYSLFKQASVGDVNTDRPGMFDFKGRAKWDAWEKKRGMSQADARQAYIDKVATLT